ncbi:MAG: hypothetical protein EP334_10005 [Gammaproteobacteria bacterium]|nr:MAG: hypothetical protein EP334_10005 [Gammaproteobacteria bacterium]
MHHDAAKASFQGELWTQDKAWCNDIPPGVNVIQSADGKGLSDDPAVIHQGANSGYQAINLAYHFGARTILLLGFDMQGVGTHWFGKHDAPGLSAGTDYATLVNAFRTIKPERHGIEIINCSRRTALDCFPRMDLHEALQQARHHPRHRAEPGRAA